MACNKPLDAYRLAEGGITFDRLKAGRDRLGSPIELPCGRCMGCRIQKKQEWTTRLLCEAEMHAYSYFITLTYNKNPLHVSKNDVQLFLDRFRKKHGKFRYYLISEYGDLRWRPHYHACIYGPQLNLKRVWRGNEWRYTSTSLESLWGHGLCDVGQISSASAAYVANYANKKLMGYSKYIVIDDETGEITELEDTFALKSLKPGLGASWIDKYQKEVIAHDGLKIIRGGEKLPIGRYLMNRLTKGDQANIQEINLERPKNDSKLARESKEAHLRAKHNTRIRKL